MPVTSAATNWTISDRIVALIFAGKPADLMVRQLKIKVTKGKRRGKFGLWVAICDADGQPINEFVSPVEFDAEEVVTLNGLNRAFEFIVSRQCASS